VAPPSNSLLRVGGDYEIEATGPVSFGQKSTADPIIGTYKWMSGYSKDLGACKFTPDGKIITTSGANGDWKLFDEATSMYVLNIDGEARTSLKFVPGRGLVDAQGIPAFQLVR
jgi:predicted helicase